MSEYQLADWLMGQGGTFSITGSKVSGRNGPWACPGRIAHEARARTGSVQPNTTSRSRRRWDDSEGLYGALADGLTALMDGQDPHTAAALKPHLTATQRRFVQHALHELTDLPDLIADSVGTPLSYQYGSSDFFRQNWGQVYLTGPEFANDDDTIREAVRLGYSPLRDPQPEHIRDFAAVVAMVLASKPERRRIRVSEFSLADGAYRVLFDGTPEQAQQLYASRTDPVEGHLVLQAISRTELNPGSGCGECQFLQVCPGPQRLPSALGIDQGVATRGLSSTDLTVYDDCPTRFHAQRRSHLPVRYGEGGAGEDFTPRNRGIATHAFLKWAHSRTPHQECALDDIPDPDLDPAGTATLLAATDIELDAYRLARPYLLGHLTHCIVGFSGFDNIEVEPRHVVYDEYADVVLSIEPDLTLQNAPGSHIWRETKTRNALPPQDERQALEAYPAFAVHVAMLAAGVDGNTRDSGAAELEVLTPDPDDSKLFIINISDGELVAHAQKLVAGVLLRWSQDLTFAPKPSGACDRCPMHGWCDPPQDRPAVQREPDDAEFLGLSDPF